MDDIHVAGLASRITNKNLNSALSPFAYPFAPMSLGLFDADPSRILSILHHQTMLAEEALRYLFFLLLIFIIKSCIE